MFGHNQGRPRIAETYHALFATFADGLVQHERRVYDFTALLIQIGVLRGKPALD
jgi:hypothetical protein